MTRTGLASFFASAAFLAILGAPRAADACSPPPCVPARVTLSGAIPLNAPALPFVVSSPNAPATPPFRLLDPGSVEVPTTTVQDPWWSPGSLLVPGASLTAKNGYQVVYKETCTMMGAPPDGARSFDASAAVPLPTTLGTVQGDNWKVGPRTVFTSSGMCTSSIEAVSIDVRLTPTTELAAYAPVVGYKLRVDGKDAGNAYYGQAKADKNGFIVFTLHAACGARNTMDDNGVTLGSHRIDVTGHVAGATTDPPTVSTMLNFSCTDSNINLPTDDLPEGHGTDDAGPIADPVGPRNPPVADGSDAGAAPAAAATPDLAVAGCACVTAGVARSSSSSNSALVGSLVALAAMITRVRARRRR